jgi:hypothetical protein
MTQRVLPLLIAGFLAACHSKHAEQCAEGMQYVVTGTGGECRPLTPGAQGPHAGKPAVPWTPPSGQTNEPPNPGGLKMKAEWSASGSYAPNDVVTSGGATYVCIGARGCTGTQVDNALLWQKVPESQQPGSEAKVSAPAGLPAGSNALPPPVAGGAVSPATPSPGANPPGANPSAPAAGAASNTPGAAVPGSAVSAPGASAANPSAAAAPATPPAKPSTPAPTAPPASAKPEPSGAH